MSSRIKMTSFLNLREENSKKLNNVVTDLKIKVNGSQIEVKNLQNNQPLSEMIDEDEIFKIIGKSMREK